MRMLKTFLRELMTQSKTAFSLGTLLIVFRGRRTLRTLRDFITARFSAPELPLRKTFRSEDDPDNSSRHVHDEGGEGTGDNDEVHAVPHLPHVGPRMQDQAII